jgi:hypothetical protein
MALAITVGSGGVMVAVTVPFFTPPLPSLTV